MPASFNVDKFLPGDIMLISGQTKQSKIIKTATGGTFKPCRYMWYRRHLCDVQFPLILKVTTEKLLPSGKAYAQLNEDTDRIETPCDPLKYVKIIL